MHRCNAAILNSLSRLAAAWPFQLCIFTVQLLDQFRQLQRCPQGFVVVCIPQFLCNLLYCTGITAILRQEEIRPGAQYAVLVHMMAQVSGLKVGELVHVIADCHIYDRHIPAVKAMLELEGYDAPTFRVDPEVKDFYAFTKNSFTMENYRYHPFDFEIPMAI